jgi:predicted transcriptional regulator
MRLSEELSTSIRLDQSTRDRLDQICTPDDKTYHDGVNRVIDIANQTKTKALEATEAKPN